MLSSQDLGLWFTRYTHARDDAGVAIDVLEWGRISVSIVQQCSVDTFDSGATKGLVKSKGNFQVDTRVGFPGSGGVFRTMAWEKSLRGWTACSVLLKIIGTRADPYFVTRCRPERVV